MLLHRRAAFLLTTTALSTSTPSVTITVRAMSNDNSANNGNAEAGAAKMQGALIFLHGLGDGPAGWMSLKHQLPRLQPRLANIHYVFPAAPTIPISINGGATMPGWFDLYDWPIEVGATDDRTQKLQGIETIRREVVRLQTEHGIDASRIVVGGFSQGGAVALLAAYHPQHGISSSIHQSSAASAAASSGSSGSSLAGCASLSAWLTLVDDVKDLPDAVKQTPLFWAHGQYDDKVLFDHQAFGVEKLREQGVSSIDARQYPMGHESDPQEIVALAGFLDKVIFGDGGRDEL